MSYPPWIRVCCVPIFQRTVVPPQVCPGMPPTGCIIVPTRARITASHDSLRFLRRNGRQRHPWYGQTRQTMAQERDSGRCPAHAAPYYRSFGLVGIFSCATHLREQGNLKHIIPGMTSPHPPKGCTNDGRKHRNFFEDDPPCMFGAALTRDRLLSCLWNTDERCIGSSLRSFRR